MYKFHITPMGEVTKGKQNIKVSIQVPFDYGWIEGMKFIVKRQWEETTVQLKHIKNQNNMAFFEGNVNLDVCAVYHYYFSFEANGVFKYFKRENLVGNNCVTQDECWKMSVGFDTPEWAKGANMYHIFVDRFRRGGNEPLEPMARRTIHKSWNEPPILGPNSDGEWNVDFYGGNLKGIEECVKYLKRLGITILYLSPIMKSQSNHRYDTGDYEEVDPYAGTNEGLKSLCEVAHRNGMYVILDAVFNHTGNDSKYFNQFGTYDTIGAYQSKQSPYYEFYKKFKDGDVTKFHTWWGMDNLPECDGFSEKWKSYILGKGGIIDKWFALGIDGLRADVADELTDEFIEGMRIAIRRNNSQGFFIGEVWKNPMRMNRGYLSSGKGMDSVMNYLFIDSLIRYFKYADVDKLICITKEIFTEYPDETIYTLMNFTSTHDISRAIEIFGCDDFQQFGEWAWNPISNDLNWVRKHKLTLEQYKHGREVFEAYLSVLTFMPGILSVFYGDEVGAQGIGNLANRVPYPWGTRDKKLLKFVRKCLLLRQKETMLKNAEFNFVSATDEKLIFERTSGENRIMVIVNRTNMNVEYQLPEDYENANKILTLRNKGNRIGPYGAVAFKK